MAVSNVQTLSCPDVIVPVVKLPSLSISIYHVLLAPVKVNLFSVCLNKQQTHIHTIPLFTKQQSVHQENHILSV